MDDDDRALIRRGDAAGLLAGEALDSYSLDELDARVEQLEDEILRVRTHQARAAAHRSAADALIRTREG